MSLRFRNRIVRAGGMYEDEIQPRCCEAATAVALEEPDMVSHLLALLPTEAVAGAGHRGRRSLIGGESIVLWCGPWADRTPLRRVLPNAGQQPMEPLRS